MKKLIMAAAAICAAVAANAATVNWSSGPIQTPTSDSDGTLSGNKLTSASGYTVKMYVWEAVTAAAVSYTTGDLYKWYSEGASTTSDPFGTETPISAITMTGSGGTSATTLTAVGAVTPANEGDLVYAAALFVLEDSTTGEAKWYMENSASKATAKSKVTQSNLSLLVGGTGGTTPMAWTAAAVPEPTSGLLMLLGVAGLALKRKRA